VTSGIAYCLNIRFIQAKSIHPIVIFAFFFNQTRPSQVPAEMAETKLAPESDLQHGDALLVRVVSMLSKMCR
jgi:hypothetical protein